jgi:NDP-sugar pyrophosphorylase family protein
MNREDELPAVCILAGGLGQRLGELVREVPKPLLPVAGEPFLLHQLRVLSQHGISRVVLSVGYLGELIERTIGRERFGMSIDYSYDGPDPVGTLGAIRQALPLLGSAFLVLYGDTFLRLDYREAWSRWQQSGRPAMMAVLRNEGRWDSSNAVFHDGVVVRYDKRDPTPDMQWIDYGLGGLTEHALARCDEHTTDIATLYQRLAEHDELFGFEATERFFEIGSPQALRETDSFLRSDDNSDALSA